VNFSTPARALVEQLHAHHEVVVEELGRVGAIRANATDAGGQVDHDVGPDVGEQAPDALRLPEVVVGAAGHHHLGGAALAQLIDDEGAEESRPAGDDDPARAPVRLARGPTHWTMNSALR
jgi:hypothetical protein